MTKCDPVTGACQVPDLGKPADSAAPAASNARHGWAIATVNLLQARDHLPSSIILKFFSALQHKFYVDGQDPKVVDFYASICASLALDFDKFRAVFDSPKALQAVQQEFVRCRQWGVRSFPTLLLEHDGKTQSLAQGFVTAEQVLTRLRQEIAELAGIQYAGFDSNR